MSDVLFHKAYAPDKGVRQERRLTNLLAPHGRWATGQAIYTGALGLVILILCRSVLRPLRLNCITYDSRRKQSDCIQCQTQLDEWDDRYTVTYLANAHQIARQRDTSPDET